MPGVDPIGKEIRIDGEVYQVIGLGKREGKTLGQSRDNYAIIPITTYLKQYGSHNNSIRISGKANGVGQELEAAMDEVRTILRTRRHDLPGQEDSFAIETNASFLGIWSSISGSFFIAMIAIAAISLVVGGIVIMNIMLMVVTERTREIGLRKALGARRRDIRRQFLLESSILATLGGAVGVLGGALVSVMVGQYFPTVVRPAFVAIGLGTATITGLLAGLAPAASAARLAPVEALRHE
jgi:putative ABC transport system permease protein